MNVLGAKRHRNVSTVYSGLFFGFLSITMRTLTMCHINLEALQFYLLNQLDWNQNGGKKELSTESDSYPPFNHVADRSRKECILMLNTGLWRGRTVCISWSVAPALLWQHSQWVNRDDIGWLGPSVNIFTAGKHFHYICPEEGRPITFRASVPVI